MIPGSGALAGSYIGEIPGKYPPRGDPAARKCALSAGSGRRSAHRSRGPAQAGITGSMPQTTRWPRPRTPSTPPMPITRAAGRIHRPAAPRAVVGRGIGTLAAGQHAGSRPMVVAYEPGAEGRPAGLGLRMPRPAPGSVSLLNGRGCAGLIPPEDWLVAFGGGMEAGARSPHPGQTVLLHAAATRTPRLVAARS
jgi:hypothetical protein